MVERVTELRELGRGTEKSVNGFVKVFFREKGGAFQNEGEWFRVGFSKWKNFPKSGATVLVFATGRRSGKKCVKKFGQQKLQLCAAVGGLGATVCSSVLDRGILSKNRC